MPRPAPLRLHDRLKDRWLVVTVIKIEEIYCMNRIKIFGNKAKDSFLIYGEVSGSRDLLVGDLLCLMEEEITFQVLGFPLIRKIPFKENNIHILIKPINQSHILHYPEQIIAKTLYKT